MDISKSIPDFPVHPSIFQPSKSSKSFQPSQIFRGSPPIHLPDFIGHPALISSSLPVVFDLYSHPP